MQVAQEEAPTAQEKFADWLGEFRVFGLKMTQQQLADHLDVSASAVHKWETGQRLPGGPTIQLLYRMGKDSGWGEGPDVDRPSAPRKAGRRRIS